MPPPLPSSRPDRNAHSCEASVPEEPYRASGPAGRCEASGHAGR